MRGSMPPTSQCARVEAFFSRWKRIIGDRLRFQTEDRQKVEIAIVVQILNYRLGLGGPDSVRTAASERREGFFVSNITSRQQGSFGSPEPTSARSWHGPRRRHRARRPAGKERARLGCGERAATAAAAPPHRRNHP